MKTDTVFKGKICPRCKNNHDNSAVLCSFCEAEAKRRMDKVQPIPPNYWVECLIQREGDTTVALGGVQYRFRRNEAGHSVCEIINPGHYKQFTERMGSFYRAYAPDTDYPEIRQATEPDQAEAVTVPDPAVIEPAAGDDPDYVPPADDPQQDTGEWKEPSLLPEADNNHPRGKACAARGKR